MVRDCLWWDEHDRVWAYDEVWTTPQPRYIRNIQRNWVMKSYIIEALNTSLRSLRQYKLVQFQDAKAQEAWDTALNQAISSLAGMKELVKNND